LVGLFSLAVLIATPRIPRLRIVPPPLVAVVLATALSWGLGLNVPTLATKYGSIPRSFTQPSLEVFHGSLIVDLLPAAFAVAILAGIESLLSAVVADGMAGTTRRHNPDGELRGQGLGNIAVSFFGGMPATAAIARTAAGIRSGATGRLTGVFHALTVLAALLVLGGLAGHVPMTTLAAILFIVAWRIAEAPELIRLLRRAPREDAVVLALTVVITVFFDLTYAIGFGVLASAVLLLARLAKLPAARELLPDETGRIREVSPELATLIRSRPDIAVFTAEGLLSFHSAATFEYGLSGADHRPLILRMRDIHHIDTSGLLTLEGVIEHRLHAGQRVILTAVRPSVREALDRFGILGLVGEGNVFEHTRCAIAAIDAQAASPATH
jgi:SulP family sulfate permease